MRHLHELQGPDAALWRSLAARWDAPAEVAGPSCTAWPNLGVACYRSSSASLALVRQLNRPVLLTLQQAGTKPPTAQSVPPQPSATAGTPRQVLLVGLDDTTAWLAQPANADAAGDPLVRVPLTELAAVWRGELQTLWRTPPGWRGTTGHGDSPVVQEWISQQLDGLLAPAGAATPAPGANSAPPRPLEDRLRAFQATQGLQPDGLIGPITLMQLNHASGVTEPHLHAGR
jgi:general secretion pathway protein A